MIRRDPRCQPIAVFCAVALVAVLAACAGEPDASSPPAETASATSSEEPAEEPAPASYDVRGEVVAVPDAEADPRTLRVHHEAIDDLVGLDGTVWGMDAMTMEFPVAPDVGLEGIEVGDKVSMTLVVDWVGPVAQQLTRVEELPADTELEFREAHPPEEVGGEEEAGGGDAGGDEPAADADPGRG